MHADQCGAPEQGRFTPAPQSTPKSLWLKSNWIRSTGRAKEPQPAEADADGLLSARWGSGPTGG